MGPTPALGPLYLGVCSPSRYSSRGHESPPASVEIKTYSQQSRRVTTLRGGER